MSHLLDTCTFLWMTQDPRKLPLVVREVLSNQNSSIFVSSVTAWELGLKVAKNKLQLPQPMSHWFPAVCQRNEVWEIHLTGALAAASTELPPIHADPFDRILVTTALAHHLTILTPDQLISCYPNVKTLW